MELAVGLGNGYGVDAGFSALHEVLGVEFPLLVAVGAEPLALGIVVLVLEAHGGAVLMEAPQLLDEAVLVLVGPLADEEGPNGVAAGEELTAVAPAAVGGVGQGYAGGVAGISGVFGEAGLLGGGCKSERGQGRTNVGHDSGAGRRKTVGNVAAN